MCLRRLGASSTAAEYSSSNFYAIHLLLGAIQASRPGEDAEDDLVEQMARGQEEPALDTPGGNLDEGSSDQLK